LSSYTKYTKIYNTLGKRVTEACIKRVDLQLMQGNAKIDDTVERKKTIPLNKQRIELRTFDEIYERQELIERVMADNHLDKISFKLVREYVANVIKMSQAAFDDWEKFHK